jgi:hypothetical protein
MGEMTADLVLRALVVANHERKLAQKARDQALITAAEARLTRAWKTAKDYVAREEMRRRLEAAQFTASPTATPKQE